MFDWLQTKGGITDAEMLRTFNCGVGMVLCVPGQDADRACARLREAGETAWPIGHLEVAPGRPSVRFVWGGAG